MSTHLWGVVALLSTVIVVVMGIIGTLLRTSAPAAEAPNFYAMVFQFLRDGFSYAPNPCLALGISPISQREPSYPCESRY